jgi:hypothetical protein
VRLDALISKLDAVASSNTLDGVKRRVAVEGLKLIANCFRTTTDPYGVSWPLLKRPRPGGPVEDKTGAMKGSALAGPIPDGVRFYFGADYARFQHWGTLKNPQRLLLPVAWLGIPPAWKTMISDAFRGQLREAMR